jgi:SAM-dependent methyltransferase
MLTVKEFYNSVWGEYADPRYHPITADALKLQSRIVHAWISAQRPQRILDLGCGPAPVVNPNWAPLVVSADIIHEMLLYLRQKDCYEAVCLDARRLPFQEKRFQLIWCSLLVDHIHEVRQWIDELVRVLTPGGTLGLASWQRSRLPSDRYPEGSMCFTMATGEELLVPSFSNWDEALQVLRARDPNMQVESYSIVPDQYILEVAWARVATYCSLRSFLAGHQ